MKVLVACEFSGIVREAFNLCGHTALSADILPSELPGDHYQGDVRDIMDQRWDLMIAHPPCTHLAVSGARWFKDKTSVQKSALEFVHELMDAPIDRIAIENPVSVISSKIRKPDQIIQPWWFGHPETKATCLWLKNLPKLQPSNEVKPNFITTKDGKRYSPIHHMSGWLPPEIRRRERSRTYPGIAKAMAEQWGSS